MKKILNMNEQKGITLLVLIITVIVLLILAGITIGALTGENGIISNSKTAKEETEIANEKEILEKATVEAMGKNKYGNIEESELQSALNKETGDGKTEAVDTGEEFEVLFINSNRYYTVDKDGNVGKMNEHYEDKNPGNITVGKDGEKLDGSKDQPYEIWCIEDLVKLSEMVNNGETFSGKYVVLKTDLNFNSNFSYTNPDTTEFDIYLGGDGNTSLKNQLSENGKGFMSIGKNIYTLAFRGDFDGQNHNIKNIYIKGSNAGLFGAAWGENNTKKISNLNIEGQIIVGEGASRAGGIIAWGRGILIENCHSQVNIKGSTYGMGGIVGICQYAEVEIKNCTNEGSLENLNNSTGTGGIIGVIQTGLQVNMVNTYNYGTIKGANRVGGLIGDIGGIVKIYNCYQLKEVTGDAWTGGIIGRVNSNSSNVALRNIYNIGEINCNPAKGGIIGTIDDTNNSKINSNNVYYKKKNGLTGIYNQDDSKFNITGYGEEEWNSNDIVQKLNSGRETQEEGINKSDWKIWKLGENGYPTF